MSLTLIIKLTIVLLILIFQIPEFHYLEKNVFASSSSLPRQVIIDRSNDWESITGKPECSSIKQNFTHPDIQAVSYYSDGKKLNATIWLSSPIEEPQGSNYTKYTMTIDIISPYDKELDYQVVIRWNAVKGIWIYEVLELGPNKETRVLHRINDYTVFSSGTGILGETTKYVELYLDLNKIIYPDKFSVFFSAEHYIGSFEGLNFHRCHIADVSDGPAYIPLPQFVLSASPISFILRPGEEKDIEIKINSTLQADSEIALFTNQIKNIDSKFIPVKMLLPSNSFTTSTLHIKAQDNANPSIDTIPIFANITFPNTQYYSKEKITNNSSLPFEATSSTEKSVGLGIGEDYNQNNITSNNKTRDFNLEMQQRINSMSIAMSQASESAKLAQLVELGAFLNNNISKTITEAQQLTIIVENYPIQESFNDVMKGLYALWNDNKEIAILIIGIFLTPFGAWAFDRIVKKEKKKRIQRRHEE